MHQVVVIACLQTNFHDKTPYTVMFGPDKCGNDHKVSVVFTFLFTVTTNNYKSKNWLQFLFIVKAAVLKQQISKFYPQIQRTEDSDHIYFRQRPFINVKAIFCA